MLRQITRVSASCHDYSRKAWGWVESGYLLTEILIETLELTPLTHDVLVTLCLQFLSSVNTALRCTDFRPSPLR